MALFLKVFSLLVIIMSELVLGVDIEVADPNVSLIDVVPVRLKVYLDSSFLHLSHVVEQGIKQTNCHYDVN